MKKHLIVPLIFVLVSVAAPWSISSATAANTYRWVDENGHVHYSDQIPPQDVGRAYSVINKEQLEEEQRLQAKHDEQLRLAKEKAVYDRILLDTYPKVSDLEETRDRYIATLEGLIKVAQHKLGNLNRDLDKLSQSAADLEREGKPVPEDMSKDIANLQAQVEAETSFIAAQHKQQQDVRDKFAADINRFKELKAQQQSKN